MLRNALTFSALFISSLTAATAHSDSGDFNKALAGRIDGRFAFTMQLENAQGKLTGHYRYLGKSADINLNGTIDSSGHFQMDESQGDPEHRGPRTGTFKGVVTGQTLNGTWESNKSGRVLSVEAHQTAQVVIGSERETFKQAVGTYVLDNISGWCCASTLWDTAREKGHWRSNSSVLSGGVRDGGNVRLTRDDLSKLDSMTVTVNAALTTDISVEGKLLLSIPYSEVGKSDVDADGDASIDPITQSSSLGVDDSLLPLYRRRQPDVARGLSGSYLSGDDADAVEVDYDVLNDTFTVQTMTSSTWKGSTFTFKRKGP